MCRGVFYAHADACSHGDADHLRDGNQDLYAIIHTDTDAHADHHSNEYADTEH